MMQSFYQFVEGKDPDLYDHSLAKQLAHQFMSQGQMPVGGAIINGTHQIVVKNTDEHTEWIPVSTKVSPRVFHKLIISYMT